MCAMGDPFQTTYEGSRQGLGTIGTAFQAIGEQHAKRKELEKERRLKTGTVLAGMAEKGIYPEGTGETFQLPGFEGINFKKKKTFTFDEMMRALNTNKTGGNPLGITGATWDPETGEAKFNIGQTQESKVEEAGQIAAGKEEAVQIGKAKKLETVGKSVEREWLETSPYKGLITKTGLVPVLGQWDIIKKGMGATSAQRQDQAYASFVQGIRAQLAKGMGDVGNLSEQEQRAVIQLVPKLYDSYESGILKLGNLAKLVEDIKSTRGVGQTSGQGQYREGQTATNPKTGQKITFRGGKWQ